MPTMFSFCRMDRLLLLAQGCEDPAFAMKHAVLDKRLVPGLPHAQGRARDKCLILKNITISMTYDSVSKSCNKKASFIDRHAHISPRKQETNGRRVREFKS